MSRRLTQYLNEAGIHVPVDAAQQLQITMLHQWLDHLEVVLTEETDLDRAERDRVVRAMMYGAVPQNADAQLRIIQTAQQVSKLAGYSGG